MTDTKNVDNRTLRAFGLIVGGIFGLIGLYRFLRYDEVILWTFIVSAALVAPALILPRILYWPYRGWMVIGHVLGWINTRIILGLIFFVFFTPIGSVMRLFGYDPMERKFDSESKTYRHFIENREQKHFERQF